MRTLLLASLFGVISCADPNEPAGPAPSEPPQPNGQNEPQAPRQTDDSAAPEDSGVQSEVGWEISWVGPEADVGVDECAETCLSVQVLFDSQPQPEMDVTFEQEDFGHLGAIRTDDDGLATLCVGQLGVGTGRVAATLRTTEELVRDYRRLEVRPFGYASGLEKPIGSLPTLWEPAEALRLPDNPVLAPGEPGSWDSAGVILPSVVRHEDAYFMYFSGTDSEDYSIGVATSDDGVSWTEYEDNPIISGGGEEHPWRRYATNGPNAIVRDGRVQLWYAGRAGETGDLTIGLAESDDGLRFEQYSANPVFSPDPANADWEGSGVAHPSVIYRDGVYEMWYSTGLHRIGYAVSADGISWTRYCGGPILEGLDSGWEAGDVKSAEVVYKDGLYLMTYSGGGSGDFSVGWALSRDGIRWSRTDSPIIEAVSESDWESISVLGANLSLHEGGLRMWYSGSAPTGTSIGIIDASWGGM